MIFIFWAQNGYSFPLQLPFPLCWYLEKMQSEKKKVDVKTELIPCIAFLSLTMALKSFMPWFFSSVFFVLYIFIICIFPKCYCSSVRKLARYNLFHFVQCQNYLLKVFIYCLSIKKFHMTVIDSCEWLEERDSFFFTLIVNFPSTVSFEIHSWTYIYIFLFLLNFIMEITLTIYILYIL